MYRAVRQLVAAYVSRQLDDLDEETAEQIYSDFEIDLKLTLDSLKTKIRNQKVTQEKLQSLTKTTLRRRLRDAFDELGMEKDEE